MPNGKRVFSVSLVLFFILLLMHFAQAQPYPFTLSNTGNKAETYELSVDLFSEYITFSENPVHVPAKESKTVTLNAEIPCEKAGSYSINFIVYGRGNNERIEIPFDINVASCYGYNVQIGEKVITENSTKVIFRPHEGSYDLCISEKASIPVLITNTGQPTSFEFKLDDAAFASLSGKKIFLQPNQKGVVYVTPEPIYERNYTLNLSIITDRTRNVPIELRIKKCYSVWADFGIDNIAICGCEPYSYDIFVGNDGTKEKEIGVELDGPEWLSLGLEQNFELNAGENISIAFNIDAPCTVRKYSASLIAYLTEQPDIRAEDSIDITLLSKDDCYRTKIETEEKIRIDYNGISLPLKAINYGAEQITYSVVLEGPEWVKAGNEQIILASGDTKVINLDIKPGEDTEKGNYKVKITLDSEKASYSKDIIIRLREKNVALENISRWYGSYSLYVWSVAGFIVVILLLVLAVRKIKVTAGEKRKAKRNWVKWLVVVLVLLVIYLISIFSQQIWGVIAWYRYYLYTIIILAGLVYWVFRHFKKAKKKIKKKEERKKPKKIEEDKKALKHVRKAKKQRRYLRPAFVAAIALIIIGIFIYLSVYYNLSQPITDFLLVYYAYIIAGIIILIVLILLLRFDEQVIGFFKGKNKRQRKSSK